MQFSLTVEVAFQYTSTCLLSPLAGYGVPMEGVSYRFQRAEAAVQSRNLEIGAFSLSLIGMIRNRAARARVGLQFDRSVPNFHMFSRVLASAASTACCVADYRRPIN